MCNLILNKILNFIKFRYNINFIKLKFYYFKQSFCNIQKTNKTSKQNLIVIFIDLFNSIVTNLINVIIKLKINK